MQWRGRLGPPVVALGLLVSAPPLLGCNDGRDATSEADEGSGDDTGESSDGDTCAAELERAAVRLPDRHIENATASLLGIVPPPLKTDATRDERFIPDKRGVVTGGIATNLQIFAEEAAAAATEPGHPIVACNGDEEACATAFIERFASRAFRRELSDDDRAGLLDVYRSGRTLHQSHAGGLGLVIQAVLQSPSFLYQLEAAPDGSLSDLELAAKISFMLTDTLPDDPLWDAALAGDLSTPEGRQAQIERLLAKPEVRAQVERIFARFFEVPDVAAIDRASLPPELVAAMADEMEALIGQTLQESPATLASLLTSRVAVVDPSLAELYGVEFPGGDQAEVVLPEGERAGMLTRAGLMALKARGDDSTAIFRGLLVARNLLCIDPPPPDPADVAQGEEINASVHTERERVQARAEIARCNGCHAQFDPLGITFEHYDGRGQYRDVLATPDGEVPVDASWPVAVADVQGQVHDAVELSALLAESSALRHCFAKKMVGYALTRGLSAEETCAADALAASFAEGDGDLWTLIESVARWEGLRLRRSP